MSTVRQTIRQIARPCVRPVTGNGVSAGSGATPLLLDTYTGSEAALSLYNLSNSWNSAVVRVRRSSDSAEQNFTASEYAAGDAETFCGAGDGFLATLFDQSGNSHDHIAASAAEQPKLIESGVAITDSDGFFAFDFEGSNDQLAASSLIGQLGVNHCCIARVCPTIVTTNAISHRIYTRLEGLSSRGTFGFDDSDGRILQNATLGGSGGGSVGPLDESGVAYKVATTFGSGTNSLILDTTVDTTASGIPASTATSVKIGSGGTSRFYRGKMTTIVFWPEYKTPTELLAAMELI